MIMEDEAAKLKLKLKRSKSKPKPKLKNKKRKSSINLYRHVPSKVAESIRGHGSVISYPCRMKKARPMSEPRATNKKYRSVKPKVKSQFRAGSVRSGRNKRVKKNKQKSRNFKKGNKTENAAGSMFSVNPVNVRTEIAVKLFPEPKNADISPSMFSKQTRARSTVKAQTNWLKRNSRPKKTRVSEYEQFEEAFIKGKCHRMGVIDHSYDVTVRVPFFIIN
jgi:hypothetical protein